MRLTVAAKRGALTPALPMPYPALEASGLRLRRGQVSLTVAAPGVGKSMLWLNLAVRMGVPALYWSADTDQHDVLMRTLALLTQYTTEQVEEQYRVPGDARSYYDRALTGAEHVDWVFDSAIPAVRVAERLSAFGELHGQYPHLVVLDNLSNSVEHQSDQLAEQQEFMTEIQRLARFTKAHFAVLAHAKGEYESGLKPIPQSGVLNNLAKIPEVLITAHWKDASNTQIGLNICKNRSGKPDPGAARPVYFPVDYSRAFVGGAT